jgi:hypothetical protein
MSKFIDNPHGFMGLTLTNLGLFIASGVLLLAICSLVAHSDWQRTEELHAIAHDISSRIQDLDATFFEHSVLYQFPPKNYDYAIAASTEYITVSTKDTWGTTISVKERFVIHPWPRNDTINWTAGSQLHNYLNTTYGHWGTQQDPLPSSNLTEFEQNRKTTIMFLALHPLEIRSDTQLTIEKVTIFDDNGENHAFVLLYQTL